MSAIHRLSPTAATAADPMPLLYSFRRCPYAMRARLALLSSGQQVELYEVALAHKPAAMLQASPKGTVPVLVLADGTVLEQSLDIMLWALRANDPQGWLPAGDTARREALEQIGTCDGAFKCALDRYKYPHRFGLSDGLFYRQQGAQFLDVLNADLGARGSLHVTGWGLADAAIAPFVRQFAHTDVAWFATQPWGHLQRWLVQFEGSEAFARIMQRGP